MPTDPEPANERELWEDIAAELGFKVPDSWRRYARERGTVKTALDTTPDIAPGEWEKTGADRRRAHLEYIVEDLGAMARAGVPGGPIAVTPAGDGRWRLIAELSEASQRATGTPPAEQRPWAPITIERRAVLDFDTEQISPLRAGRVTISFDDRLSLRALVDELRRLWPELRDRGYVRRTRPLGERTIALLRFVSLRGEPDTPWRARREAWNESCREGWRLKDVRAFTTAFHRGEFQLTGVRQGLAPYYERAALLQQTDPEAFQKLLKAGDPGARKAQRRFWKRMRETLKPAIERFESWRREDQADLGRLTSVLESRARQLEADIDQG
ncbi:MAG: hypothetical protein V3S31_01890 [Dehalococcoidia bacterium]